MANGGPHHWDNITKVPYLTKGTSFLSYDDSRSIGYKAAYVRDQQLGGVIVWTAFGDLRAGAITNPSGKLPFSPTADAPLINVVNSVLAGDPLPADGTEGPAPASGPPTDSTRCRFPARSSPAISTPCATPPARTRSSPTSPPPSMPPT